MKSILASKTFWGAISSLIVSAFAILDIKVAADEVQVVVESAAAIISFGLVVWGRISASKRVTVGKTETQAITSLVLLMCLISPGCQHHWPKDSYIQGASSTINTPWGPSVQKIQVLATGTAAAAVAQNPPKLPPVDSKPPVIEGTP